MKDAQPRLPPLFQKNEVLFGHDGTMGLLAFESAILPEGIALELDGRYPAMFSYKMKN
jgi:hypothetical protein